MEIDNSARKAIIRMLNLNKKMTAKFEFLLRTEIKKYGLIDSPNDIEQNIFEGIISFLIKPVELRHDLITKKFLSKKFTKKLKNKKIIKIISKQYNIFELTSSPRNLNYLISNITSDLYGNRLRTKNDILKISITKQYEYIEDSIDTLMNLSPAFDVYDSDTEIDTELKYFINKYFTNLNENEQIMFNKYFYEDIPFSEMINLGYTKNEYALKSFIKKTKSYFHKQLIED